MSILVFNAGSSSLKFGVYSGDDDVVLASGSLDLEDAGVGGVPGAVAHALQALDGASAAAGGRPARAAITAVGQRVVHGGATLSDSVRIDGAVKAEIGRLAELAPLHNPPALEAIEAVDRELPGVPQVAVFDTAFYRSLDPVHHVYPLPYDWYQRWGVRRFGFHGISHGYCAARAAAMLRPGRAATGLRVISCHLGNGCSATATRGGVAVATTMGFTPIDGLMMGTRPGALDPGILTYVQKHRGVGVDQLEASLNHDAGLKGISGLSGDYRQVADAARDGHARARLALELYVARIREAVGSLAVTLGGLDALVFTAGVGEHAAPLRAAVCAGTQFLGLRLDPDKNAACQPDADIADDRAGDAAGARILVIHTEEELAIAREVRRVIA